MFNQIKTHEEVKISLELIRYHEPIEVLGYPPSYYFEIRLRGTEVAVGRLDLRLGTVDEVNYSGHLGYFVKPEHRGNGYGVMAVNLIKEFAREQGMNQLIIACNPDNLPSNNVAMKLGATWINQVDIPRHHDRYTMGDRVTNRYLLELR